MAVEEEDFLGAEEMSAGFRTRLWFGSEASRQRVASRLREPEESARAPAPARIGGFTVRPAPREPDRDWTAPFREFFAGVQAGGFFIHPPTVPAPSTLRSLQLVPGPAFGTGMHPTTRMVLEMLDECLRSRPSGVSVLDVGTGSGLLAVAAAILGANPVIGLDHDPVAVRTAGETAAANGQAERVLLREGDFRNPEIAAGLDSVVPDGFDLILANLSADLLTAFWHFAAVRLRTRGRILVSGFLQEEASRVLESSPRRLLRVTEVRAEPSAPPDAECWVAAALERAGDSANAAAESRTPETDRRH